MRTHRPDPTKRERLPREFLHSTYTIPSSFSGNYEGDITMFQQHTTPSKRHLTFRTDSDEEYSDTSHFDEAHNTDELLRNRLFLLSELSPDTSKVILQNVVYLKIVQLFTIVVFLIALVLVSSYKLLKQAVTFLVQRRALLFELNKSAWVHSVPIVSTIAVVYCYFHCQSACYEMP